MSYFTKFDQINYNNALVRNIFDSVIMKYNRVERNSLYYKYSIEEGERPEHIAYNLYGNAKYHWIILLTNKIVDPNFDWYLSKNEVEALAKSKYNDMNDIHHYVYIGNGTDGLAIQNYTPGIDAVQYKYGDILSNYYVQKDLEEYKIANGGNLPEFVSPVTNFQYEIEENDKRREIKIISEIHIPKILTSFDQLMDDDTLYLVTI